MDKLHGRFYLFSLFLAVISGVFFLSAGAAQAQCQAQITKVAEGGEGVRFEFLVETMGGTGLAEFFGGQTVVVNLVNAGEQVTLTELSNPGWVLADHSCEATASGIEVTEIEDGVVFNCIQEIEGVVQAECTFVNVRATNVPTLSEWGMIAAAAGLAIVGVFFAVRRRRAFNS